MLNHKFYLGSCSDQSKFIRISDELMLKMESDLLRYKFIWNGYEKPMEGLNKGLTFLKKKDIIALRNCLLQHSKEKEYKKFMDFIDLAIIEDKEICHEDGSHGSLVHGFVLVSNLPKEINYRDYKNHVLKIQDQFIREHYGVFKNIIMHWDKIEDTGGGFNYYGETIITPTMARELLTQMNEFLINNDSEEAEYFIGEEHEILSKILNQAISENKYIIHFGI